MGLFSLEQSKALYRADFVVYGLLVLAAAVATWVLVPPAHGSAVLGWAAMGLATWSLAEYLLHRFVLHGVPPFEGMHARHHERPQALVATPTVVTVALFAGLVFAPVAYVAAPWQACAFMLGLLLAYFGYISTHHAVHHARGQGAWLRRQRHWHGAHHRSGAHVNYGVTVPLWDHVFRSAQRRVRQRTDEGPSRRLKPRLGRRSLAATPKTSTKGLP